MKYHSVDLLEDVTSTTVPRFTNASRCDQLNDNVSQWLYENVGVRYTDDYLRENTPPHSHWTLSHSFRNGQLVISVNFTDAAMAALFKLTWL